MLVRSLLPLAFLSLFAFLSTGCVIHTTAGPAPEPTRNATAVTPSSTQEAGPEVASAHVEDEGEEENANPGGVTSWWRRRLDEDGTLPANNVSRMIAEREQMLTLSGARGLDNWFWFGPGNIGGRIRALLVHPTQPGTMWAGSAGGGLWKTTTGGANWSPLDNFPNVLPIGCMAMDPTNPSRILVGTGEGVFNSVAGTSNLAAPRGAGIWVTTDGGTNWSQIQSTKTADWYFVNRIVFHPTNANILLAATETGIWRSTDAGQNWTRQTTNRAYYDIDFHPTNGSLAVAGGRDVQAAYTTNGGLTWLFASGLTSPQRVEITYARSNPALVYAAVSSGGRIKVYESSDGGRTYALKSQGSGIQTWSRYNNAFWVDPVNPQYMLLGGVPLNRSIDGGRVFTRADSGVHVDHHAIVEHPQYDGTTNSIVFNGNDGGIYRAAAVRAGTVQWQSLNNNLGVTQFYGGAMSPAGTIVTGAQDNGTMRSGNTPNTWTRFFGGDGGFAAADPTDPNYVYGEVQNLRIFRSTNGGQSASYIYQGISEPRPNFIPPFILDPNNPNTMLAGGARLWRSTNVKTGGSPSWSPIKNGITCVDVAPQGTKQAHFATDPPCNISAITVAPGNSDIIWVGHNNGDVYMTTNGTSSSLNVTWTRMDTNGVGLPNRWVSRIAVDPRNTNKVYVSVMGYQPNNVWRSDDAGRSWKQITGTGSNALPSAPATSVAVHRVMPGWLYAGTDVGVFCSNDDGATWSPTVDIGGRSPAEELVWKDDRTLIVVTHGRGVYSAESGDPASSTVKGKGCGIASEPKLTVTPPVPGRNHTYQLTTAAANRPVWLGLSPFPALQTPIGNGCSLWVNLTGIALLPLGTTNASGAWQYAFVVPRLGSLVGATFTAQTLIQAPGGPAFGNAELSNGVEMVVGF